MNVLWLFGIDADAPLWVITVLVLLGLFIAYYKYMTWHFGIFKEMGIPYPKPLPILGNTLLLRKYGVRASDGYILKEYAENGKFVGIFMGRQPQLITTDLSFIKQVLVKEFNCFIDRRERLISPKPLSRALTELRGEEWRVVRNTLTPTFSGGKMKIMMTKMNECAGEFAESIGEFVEQDEAFDLLQLAGNFTMDVIARTAFGLEVNCQREKDNQFMKHGREAMDVSFNKLFAVAAFFPFVMGPLTRLGLVSVFPAKSRNFFENIAEQSLKKRLENKAEKSPDFLQLMAAAHTEATEDEHMEEENRENMRAHKHKKRLLSKDEIVGNVMLFLLAGFDTTANTLTFAGYLLAKHPEVQDKLCEEIDRVVGDETCTYDMVGKCCYVEQVINETMRLFPQVAKNQRHCTKSVTINGLHIPAGMEIGILVKVLHTDPETWPEPDKFDPDRFCPEEKAKRDPYCYMPFGIGPRSCIAMRLALMKMKIALITILQQYKFVCAPETENKVTMHEQRPRPAKGMPLKAERRPKGEASAEQ